MVYGIHAFVVLSIRQLTVASLGMGLRERRRYGGRSGIQLSNVILTPLHTTYEELTPEQMLLQVNEEDLGLWEPDDFLKGVLREDIVDFMFQKM